MVTISRIQITSTYSLHEFFCRYVVLTSRNQVATEAVLKYELGPENRVEGGKY